MNIFETIAKTTHRTEPFHSRFLADALRESLQGDRSLFDALWKLASPSSWETPRVAEVRAEQPLGQRRVDICIISKEPQKRVVGIEVKTVAASAEEGQLEKYYEGLKSNKEFQGYDVQVSYLTPFNRERAGDGADAPTVKEFGRFAENHLTAQHMSWLDIADIPWDGNEVWRQHQLFVYQTISSYKKQRAARHELNRGLVDFFGDEVTERFREALDDLGVNLGVGRTVIDLSKHHCDEAFSGSLATAFSLLLNGEGVSRHSTINDKFARELRVRFQSPPYGEVHKALFRLADAHPFVSVEGSSDYGIKTAHQKPRSRSVSLVRSDGPSRLIFGQKR